MQNRCTTLIAGWKGVETKLDYYIIASIWHHLANPCDSFGDKRAYSVSSAPSVGMGLLIGVRVSFERAEQEVKHGLISSLC